MRLLCGKAKPLCCSAARTRSRDSLTSVSARPTSVKLGRPLARCTSTCTSRRLQAVQRAAHDHGQRHDLAFNAGAVSDYRYRGISQTRLKPAVQGGVDYSAGGLYVGAWASTIKWIKDAGGDADVEIDLYGGYKGELAKDVAFDVGVLTYQYPGNTWPPAPTPPRSTARSPSAPAR
jgi:uncharacterized protein (TIGR02001 family)